MLYGHDAVHASWLTWTARLVSDSSKILAVARIDGFSRGKDLTPAQKRWKVAQQLGWMLGDVRMLPRPILHRGLQGLWMVPGTVEAEVRRQVGL